MDWLGFKLSGRPATTAVTATLHWVTDTRDAARVRYDDALLALAGLCRDRLPELHGRAPIAAEHAPDRGRTQTYDELYRAFRALYRASRRTRRRLAAVRDSEEGSP